MPHIYRGGQHSGEGIVGRRSHNAKALRKN